MHVLRELMSNKPLVAAGVSWVIAQILKMTLTLILTKEFVPERLFGPGGMPSAHSACVCALTLSVASTDHISSSMFAICVILAGVVMYDAMGVRLHAGKQAKTLNKVVDKLKSGSENEEENTFNDEDADLKEVLGHTPLQVLAGVLLGILVAMII